MIAFGRSINVALNPIIEPACTSSMQQLESLYASFREKHTGPHDELMEPIIEKMDEMVQVLRKHQPPTSRFALKHGDFEMRNVMAERQPGTGSFKLTLIDWDMTQSKEKQWIIESGAEIMLHCVCSPQDPDECECFVSMLDAEQIQDVRNEAFRQLKFIDPETTIAKLTWCRFANLVEEFCITDFTYNYYKLLESACDAWPALVDAIQGSSPDLLSNPILDDLETKLRRVMDS